MKKKPDGYARFSGCDTPVPYQLVKGIPVPFQTRSKRCPVYRNRKQCSKELLQEYSCSRCVSGNLKIAQNELKEARTTLVKLERKCAKLTRIKRDMKRVQLV